MTGDFETILGFAPLSPNEEIATCALAKTSDKEYSLHPEEERILSAAAVEKRREEFRLGRAAANFALRQLGLAAPPPILQGEGREPVWPHEFIGSITHCSPWAIAAVAPANRVWALGIDLENIERMNVQQVVHHICTDSERHWAEDRGASAEKLTMLFAAKEAIYKAYYPHCQRYFDFKDVSLRWDQDQEIFRGELLIDLSEELPKSRPVSVRCQKQGSWSLSYLVEWREGKMP
jgi:4'-phosphopantetheinyl transferase EntD